MIHAIHAMGWLVVTATSPSPSSVVLAQSSPAAASDWGPTTIATIVLAAVAALALIANMLLIRETREMSKQTKRMADAAGREATASHNMVDEVRKDREISALPYLTWDISRWPDNGTGDEVQEFKVGNFGRGPAINCRFVSVQDGRLRQSLRFELSANEKGHLIAFVHDYPLDDPSEILGDRGPLNIYHAMFCADQFGTLYRYRYRQPVADTWRVGDPTVPWASWYERLPPGISTLPVGASGEVEEHSADDEPVMDIVSVKCRRENDFLGFKLWIRNAAGGVALRVTAGLAAKIGSEFESATRLGVLASRDDPVAMDEFAVPVDAVVPTWGSLSGPDRQNIDFTQDCIFWVRYSNRFGETFLLKKIGPDDFPEISRVSN